MFLIPHYNNLLVGSVVAVVIVVEITPPSLPGMHPTTGWLLCQKMRSTLSLPSVSSAVGVFVVDVLGRARARLGVAQVGPGFWLVQVGRVRPGALSGRVGSDRVGLTQVGSGQVGPGSELWVGPGFGSGRGRVRSGSLGWAWLPVCQVGPGFGLGRARAGSGWRTMWWM